jgi:hypothetical protein
MVANCFLKVELLIAANGMFCGYVSLPQMKMSATQSFISVVNLIAYSRLEVNCSVHWSNKCEHFCLLL